MVKKEEEEEEEIASETWIAIQEKKENEIINERKEQKG